MLVDSDGDSARRSLAAKLCKQLLYGLRGCSEEQHEQKFREYIESVGNNHYGLGEIFNDPSFPSVLGLSEIISPDHLAQYQTPTAAQWYTMFCGATHPIDTDTSPLKNVCLHKEQTEAVSPDVSYDVDSFLGIVDSLGVGRNGLLYQGAPQARQNISTNVHFGLEVSGSDSNTPQSGSTSFAMLRDVPHLVLGRLVGAENISMHVFFPHLERALGISILTTAQLTCWTDKVLHPAIYKHYPGHFTQHLPAGYEHALANSKARQERVAESSQSAISRSRPFVTVYHLSISTVCGEISKRPSHALLVSTISARLNYICPLKEQNFNLRTSQLNLICSILLSTSMHISGRLSTWSTYNSIGSTLISEKRFVPPRAHCALSITLARQSRKFIPGSGVVWKRIFSRCMTAGLPLTVARDSDTMSRICYIRRVV
jgi:hypothetical protein